MEDTLSPDNIQYLSFEGGGGKGVVYLGVVKALENIYSALNKKVSDKNRQKTVEENFPEPQTIQDEQYPYMLQKELNVVSIRGAAPLFRISHPPLERPLRGISGSSAGAITAFMLAMGMSSDDIEAEFRKTATMKFNRKFSLNLPNISVSVPIPVNGMVGNGSFLNKLIEFFNKKEVKVSKYETFFEGADKQHKIMEGNANEYEFENLTLLYQVFFNTIKSLANILTNLVNTVYSFSLNPNSSSVLIRQLFFDNKTGDFLQNILFTRGLFSGLKARSYFSELLQEYLIIRWKDYKNSSGQPIISNPNIRPEKMTFKEFFSITGVDLILTGTNVTRRYPQYFSVSHTPDFPVIEAVQISMNFPLLFKPIWVDYYVEKGDEAKRIAYNGFWVDGGMLNNYPFQAFNKTEAKSFSYQGSNIIYPVAIDAEGKPGFCDCIAGFRLTANLNRQEKLKKTILKKTDNQPLDESKPDESTIKIYDTDNLLVAKEYMSDLFETFMYPSEEGQIKNEDDRRRTIEIETEDLEITDFSTPYLDKERGNNVLYTKKVNLTKQAHSTTLLKFGIDPREYPFNPFR